jgi:4-amino-4-deoxy-L-arabinose transferase-like glycosyltransferase
MGHGRRAAWAVLAAAAVVLTLFLGSRGLNEPDEGRYAELGREMAAPGGDWLVPHLNGFEHFQKPPLLYWLTAGGLRLLGVNEWGARLPSALAAWGTLALTLWLGRALWGSRPGLTAGLVLLSMGEFFALARLLTPDMLLTFWITCALAVFVRYQTGGPSWWRWLFFVAMGIGFLAKGPLALVVPATAALGWRWAAPREHPARPLPWARGLPLALLIGLSWFITLSVREPKLFEYFWRYELLQRFASHVHGRSKPVWYFLPVMLIGALPWSAFFFGLGRSAWRKLRAGALTPAHGLLLGWSVPPFVILSLSGSKLPTYILPLLPAVALALGFWLSQRARLARAVLPLTAASLAVFLTSAALLPHYNDALRQQASVRSLALLARARPDSANARFFSCEVRAHGFEFRLQRLVMATEADSDIVLPTTPEQKRRVLGAPAHCEGELGHTEQPTYGLLRAERFARSFTAGDWQVLGRAGDFVLIGDSPWRAAARKAALPALSASAPSERLPASGGLR